MMTASFLSMSELQLFETSNDSLSVSSTPESRPRYTYTVASSTGASFTISSISALESKLSSNHFCMISRFSPLQICPALTANAFTSLAFFELLPVCTLHAKVDWRPSHIWVQRCLIQSVVQLFLDALHLEDMRVRVRWDVLGEVQSGWAGLWEKGGPTAIRKEGCPILSLHSLPPSRCGEMMRLRTKGLASILWGWLCPGCVKVNCAFSG